MSGAVINRLLWVAGAHQSINEAGRKAVPTTNAIKNFQIRILAALVKLSIHPRDRRPFDDQLRRRITERGENSTRMQPTHAELAENGFPIEIAGFELACRRIAAIRNPHCPAHAVTALGEVQTVAHIAPDAIELCPFDEL